MSCTLSELKEKEVVNIANGKILGFISDIEIDICTGQVTKIFLPPQGKYFSLFSSKELVCIPWDCVEKIGSDIILVRWASPSQIPPKHCC